MCGRMHTISARIRMGHIGAAILAHNRFARKHVSGLGLAIEHAAGGAELIERDFGLHGGWVHGRFVMDALVDRDGGVDDGGLDDFALDYWLNCFVDVVVHVLGFERCGFDFVGFRWQHGRGGFDIGRLLHNFPLNKIPITSMSLFAMDYRHNLMFVFLWHPDFVLNRLDARLIVILVHLAVNSDGFLHFLDWHDRFFGYCRLENFAHFGVVLAVAV